MPTARDRIDVEIEFEMYCATCGNGICGNTQYIRGSNNKFETYCENCLGQLEHKDREIEQLNEEIAELNEQISDLKTELNELKAELNDLRGAA